MQFRTSYLWIKVRNGMTAAVMHDLIYNVVASSFINLLDLHFLQVLSNTFLWLLLSVTYQVHLSTCEGNNCYPESHVCPLNESSEFFSGLVIIPPSASECSIQENHCQLLEYYLTCLNSTSYKHDIRLYFLPGQHEGKYLQVYTSTQGLTLLSTHGQSHLSDFKLVAKVDYTELHSRSAMLFHSIYESVNSK